MLQNNRPLIIGITGNVGSGKSAFCHILTELGFSVYNADTIANQRLEDIAVINALVERYSSSILCGDNTLCMQPYRISRKKLADIVFSNRKEVEFLNSLIHPLVLKDMQEIVNNFAEQVLCFEVPLLFEAGLKECFDVLVLVTATEDIRLNRLVSRGESLESSKKRMHNQIDDKNKRTQVDFLIENNGNLEDLSKKTKALATEFIKLPFKNIRPFA